MAIKVDWELSDDILPMDDCEVWIAYRDDYASVGMAWWKDGEWWSAKGFGWIVLPKPDFWAYLEKPENPIREVEGE